MPALSFCARYHLDIDKIINGAYFEGYDEMVIGR
jgi:hypothetical protein